MTVLETTIERASPSTRHPRRRIPALDPSISLLLFLYISSAVCQQPLILISSPPTNVTLCQPYTFTWTGGAPPYTLSIRIALGQLDVPAALPFTNIPAPRFTWTPDLVEPELLARVFDSKGANATSTVFAVTAGDTRSCVKTTPVMESAPSASTIPVSGAARQGMSPEALLGLVAGAAGLLVVVAALLYWLWLRARDRRREFSRVDVEDHSTQRSRTPMSNRLSWLLWRPRSVSAMPKIVVTSPTVAGSVFNLVNANANTHDGDIAGAGKAPSIVIFDAKEEAEFEQLNGRRTSRAAFALQGGADAGEDVPLLELDTQEQLDSRPHLPPLRIGD